METLPILQEGQPPNVAGRVGSEGALGEGGRAMVVAAVLAGLVLTLAVVPAAHAADLVVSTLVDGGSGSLREAITTANGNGTADVITFSVSCRRSLRPAH